MDKPKKKAANHYIDNKEFYQHMIEWKKIVIDAENAGEQKPPVTDYIGKCFLDIAEHLSYKPNFINYPYREEMIGDGIENCIMYASNFDPDKSTNPFSYFTQIIYYAFLRRIQKEKKQAYIKYKAVEAADIYNEFPRWVNATTEEEGQAETVDVYAKYFSLSKTDIEKFTPKKKKKTTKKKKTVKKKTAKKKKKSTDLDDFLEE